MPDVAIRAEGLGKKYTIGHQAEAHRYVALRDVMARRARSLWRKTSAVVRGKPLILGDTLEEVWALRDVTFDVGRGEAVGIIGRNGAGKSTLLKVLSRITEPSAGRVSIRGRVASLLEVGTGFHPELTGRENIYLNGAILGMPRAQIRRQFDEIVAFAEVDKFLDTPVKRYSSGMYVRLAFAVAAHLEPEILVVDEVLAVGDAQFQKKCLGRMGTVAHEGRTVLFVSHNMGAVQGLCRRAIWIDRGCIVSDGDVTSIVGQYVASASDGFMSHVPQRRTDREGFVIEHVSLRNEAGDPVVSFKPGECIRVDIHYFAPERVSRPGFWVTVESQFGALFGANMLFDDLRPEYVEGRGVISCVFRDVTLLPQGFTVTMGVRDHTGARNLVKPAAVAAFNVLGGAKELGMPGELADGLLDSSTPMIVPYEWRYSDGRVAAPSWRP